MSADKASPAGDSLSLPVWGTLGYSLLLIAGSFIPGSGVPTIALLGWDKLAHATAFLVLGLLSMRAVDDLGWFRITVVAWGLFLSVATELLQSITPGRNMSFYDGVADMIGVGVAMLVYIRLPASITNGSRSFVCEKDCTRTDVSKGNATAAAETSHVDDAAKV